LQHGRSRRNSKAEEENAVNIRRALLLPLVAAALAYGAFVRMPGTENVRGAQMLALIGCGMGLGVALAHLKLALSAKSK
jgi:hypothetical protein